MIGPGANGLPGASPRRAYGPYVVEGPIGRGGMGAVYRARHRSTGAVCALKVILAARLGADAPRALARFRREAEVLARIDGHPGIVRVHAFGIDAGLPWCAMELVSGQSLADRLEAGTLDDLVAARLVADVARAVEHAHERGVLHRDLKPGNILVQSAPGAPPSRPRVVDFGLAYDAFADTLTRTGELVGTPAFMAPEQVARSRSGSEEGAVGRRVGPATDVYGLGAVLYACLVGSPPFQASEPVTLLWQLANEDPTPPRATRPGVAPGLEAICLRALEKDPARRYASAAAMADDLERFGRGEAVTARAPGRLDRLRRRLRRRSRGALAAAAVAALALVTAAVAVTFGVRGGAADGRGASDAASFEGDLDAALVAAAAGERAALESAAALGERARRLGRDEEPAVRERLEVIAGLAALAAGDPVFVRTAALDAPPWVERRGAVITVLVEHRRTDDLVRILDRVPTLIGPVGAGLIADAIAARRLEADDDLVAMTVAALGRAAAGARDAAHRERCAERRRGVLVRRLERLVSADRVEVRDVGAVCRALVVDLRAGARGVPIEPDALERFIDVAFEIYRESELEPADQERLRDALAIVEAAVLLHPSEHNRVEQIIDAVTMQVAVWQTMRDPFMLERAFAFALLLQRLGGWPDAVETIEQFAPKAKESDARLAEAIADADGFDPTEVVTLLAVRVEQRRRRKGDAGRVTAIIKDWSAYEAVLARERRRGDLPAWALTWLASVFVDANLVGSRARNREGAGADVVVKLGAALASWSAPGASDPGESAIDRLHELGWERRAALPPGRRHVAAPLAYAEWAARAGASEASVARAAEVLIEGLGPVADEEPDARPEAATHLGPRIAAAILATGRRVAAVHHPSPKETVDRLATIAKRLVPDDEAGGLLEALVARPRPGEGR